MNIALDYDDTFTKDKWLWYNFIMEAQLRNHRVYCVTMRSPNDDQDVVNDLADRVDGIFYTDGQDKETYMQDVAEIHIHIWIDDKPPKHDEN